MTESFAAELQRVLAPFAHTESHARTQAELDAVIAAGAISRETLIAVALDPHVGDARHTACWLLGRLAVPDGLPALLVALRDREPALRRRAAIALRELQDPAALAPLLEVMDRDPDIEARVCATLALGALAAPAAAEPLRRVLADATAPARVRAAAAEALADLDDAEAVPVLIAALADREPEVRFFAAFALGALGAAAVKALEALERLADDAAVIAGYGSVQDEARTAIEHIRYAAAQAPDRLDTGA